MKKAVTLVLILTCLLGLIGCDPGANYLDKNELLENTVKIELFQYENEKPKLLNLDKRKKPSFDFSKATLIGTLDAAHYEAILTDVAETEFLVLNKALNEPIGKTLVLYQSDGDMIVLFGCVYTNKQGNTSYYGDCYEFDENGVFVSYIGDVSHVFLDTIESTYFKNTP